MCATVAHGSPVQPWNVLHHCPFCEGHIHQLVWTSQAQIQWRSTTKTTNKPFHIKRVIIDKTGQHRLCTKPEQGKEYDALLQCDVEFYL